MPIILSDGTFFGTLCAVDPDPCEFTRRQVELVVILARLLATQIELHQRRELFDRFMDLSPMMAAMKDEEGRFVYANAHLLEQLGVEFDAIRGKTNFGWLPEEQARRLQESDQRALRSDRPLESIEVVAFPRNELHHWLTIRFPIQQPSGQRFLGSIAIDVTEQRREQLELARLAAIVHSAHDAVIGEALDGTITSWNLAAERLFGYAPEEAIGRHISMLAPPGRESEILEFLALLAEGERIQQHETQRLTKDGKLIDVSITLSPIRDHVGTVVGASSIARDISESKRAQRELTAALDAQREANEELARINRMMGDFVSVVSHEFRTPLTSIQGFGELIRDEDLDEADIKDYADEIYRSAERLARLINDMLDLDRLESGRVELRLERLDFNEIVEDAVASLAHSSPAQQIVLELDHALPPITGDRDRLTQVTTNLVGNALKYSPDGGEIRVTTARDGALLHMQVLDRGLGIPADALETIFERYSRVGSRRNAAIKGTGLGLPITRQIAELHGGRVWAEAREGGGSVFHVTLPLEDSR